MYDNPHINDDHDEAADDEDNIVCKRTISLIRINHQNHDNPHNKYDLNDHADK